MLVIYVANTRMQLIVEQMFDETLIIHLGITPVLAQVLYSGVPVLYSGVPVLYSGAPGSGSRLRLRLWLWLSLRLHLHLSLRLHQA